MLTLNYKKLGNGGTPLFILHGLFGSLDNWLTLGKQWSEHFEVYLIDQRNHGRSPHAEEFSYPIMAADLADFIAQQKLEKVNLLGHSMGGKTIMQYATQHADKVEKMIVVDMATRSYPVHHDGIVEALNKLDVSNYKSRNEADEALAKDIPDLGTRLFLLKNLYRTADKSFGWRMNLPVLGANLETVGQGITSDTPIDVPALFVRGNQSHYVSDEDFSKIRSLFPKATFETLEAGHWVHAQRPKELFTLVKDFLS